MIVHLDCKKFLPTLQTNSIDSCCAFCGKIFKTTRSRKKHGRGIYCSKECQYKGLSKRKSKKIIIHCAVCNKKFERSPSHIISVYQFCSRSCAYKGRSLGFVKRNITIPYDCVRKSEYECLICGSKFIYRNPNQKYCSRTCFEVAHVENMKGPRNHFYIDGRSKNKKSYRGEEWDLIRNQVYERDNYKCQICGKDCEPGEIQAHHIVSWFKTKDNSLDNLVTLCNKCHAKVHNKMRKYGDDFKIVKHSDYGLQEVSENVEQKYH